MTAAVLLAAAAFAVQIALGLPAMPSWTAAILVPMVFVVAQPMMITERRWPHYAIILGLVWDLLLEPVVGPGAIAWSAAAVLLGLLAPLVADRSPWAWLAFGGLGAVIVTLVRHLALIPLGLATALSVGWVLTTAILTALWCGFVGWIASLDLRARWRRYRARRLR